MGNKDTAAAKPATAAAAPAKEQTQTTEQASTAGASTALQEKAAAAAAGDAKQEAAGKGKLYTVASPIKHDGEDYAAGDEIRLPEATAHRLAGYLKA